MKKKKKLGKHVKIQYFASVGKRKRTSGERKKKFREIAGSYF